MMRSRRWLLAVASLLLGGGGFVVSQQTQDAPSRYVKEVEKILTEAARADLSDPEAEQHRQRAQQLAAQHAATVRASNPTGADRLWLGYLYHLANDAEKAAASYREVLRDDDLIDELKQQARLYLIRSLSDTRRMDEAEEILSTIPSTAFNAEETRARAHETMAMAYTKQEQLPKALHHQERALAAARISGVISRIWLLGRALAQLYVAMGRKADGMKVLEELKGYFERQARLAGSNPPTALQTGIGQMDATLAQLSMLDQPAPEITAAKWIKETPTTLEALRGKVVALELWAAWCGDCRGLIPYLRDWHAKYAKQGLKILPVTRHYGYNGREVNQAAPAEEEAFLLKFKQLHNIPYGTVVDDNSRTFETYKVRSIPHIVLIDQSGIVRFVFTWYTNPVLCEYMIKRLLSEPAAAGN